MADRTIKVVARTWQIPVGVHAQHPRSRARVGMALAGLICGIVSIGLAIADSADHGILAGYQVTLGFVFSWLAVLLPPVLLVWRGKKGEQNLVVPWIALAGSGLGFVGFLLLMTVTGQPINTG